jgi:hypothetical protein
MLLTIPVDKLGDSLVKSLVRARRGKAEQGVVHDEPENNSLIFQ